jgi:hypothetical protein
MFGVPEHGPLRGAEAVGVAPVIERVQLLGLQSGIGGHRKVVRQFVCRVLELRDPADHEFTQCARHLGVETQGVNEVEQRREQRRGVRECLVQVDRVPTDGREAPGSRGRQSCDRKT